MATLREGCPQQFSVSQDVRIAWDRAPDEEWLRVITLPWCSAVDVYVQGNDGAWQDCPIRLVGRMGATRRPYFEKPIRGVTGQAERVLSQRVMGCEKIDVEVFRRGEAGGEIYLSATAYGVEPASNIDVEPAEHGQAITPDDAGLELWTTLRVGEPGDLQVTMASGQVLLIPAVQAGEWLTIKVRRVWSTNTTCGGIVGFR